jgi:hypothetical protein
MGDARARAEPEAAAQHFANPWGGLGEPEGGAGRAGRKTEKGGGGRFFGKMATKRATILIIDQGVTMYDGAGEKHRRALEIARRVVESKLRWGGGESLNVVVAGRAGADNCLGLEGVWDSAHRVVDAEDEGTAAAFNPYLRAPSAGDVAGLAPARFPRAGAAPTDLWRALGVALNNLEAAETVGGALLPLPSARWPGCVRIVIVSDLRGVVNPGAARSLAGCAGVLAEFGAQIDLVLVREEGAAGEEEGTGAGGGGGSSSSSSSSGGGGGAGMFGRTDVDEAADYEQWEKEEEMDDPSIPAMTGAAGAEEGGGGGGGGGGAPSSSSSAAGAGAGGAPPGAARGGGIGELKSLQRLLMATGAPPGAGAGAPPADAAQLLLQLLRARPEVKGRAFSASEALAAFSSRPAPAKASRFHALLHLCGGAGAGGVTLPASMFLTSVPAKPPRVGTLTEAAAGLLGLGGCGGGGVGGGWEEEGGDWGGGEGGAEAVGEAEGGAAPAPRAAPPAPAPPPPTATRLGYTVEHFQRIVAPAGMSTDDALQLAIGGALVGLAGEGEGEGEGEGGGGGGGGGAPAPLPPPAPEDLAIAASRVTPAFRYGRSLIPVPPAPLEGAPPCALRYTFFSAAGTCTPPRDSHAHAHARLSAPIQQAPSARRSWSAAATRRARTCSAFRRWPHSLAGRCAGARGGCCPRVRRPGRGATGAAAAPPSPRSSPPWRSGRCLVCCASWRERALAQPCTRRCPRLTP